MLLNIFKKKGKINNTKRFFTTTTTSGKKLGRPPSTPMAEKKETQQITPNQFGKQEGVTVVNNPAKAKQVLKKLRKLRGPRYFHAADTETIGIDVKKEGPHNKGKVICASIYVGPEHDFGEGPRIWIDNLEDPTTLLEFKSYFEDPDILKVWHNYSFDRAVLYHQGINCIGFGGDTMHMARLWDSARIQGYSLEQLSKELLNSPKRTMKERFGKLLIKKDGQEGKQIIVPDLIELQLDPERRIEWIDYSVYDAVATWQLREELMKRLKLMEWTNYHGEESDMYAFYMDYWREFGSLLTDIERVKIDVEHLKKIQEIAEGHHKENEIKFKQWASRFCPDCAYMNVGSDAQLQQFFFGGNNGLESVREFKTPNIEGIIEEGKKKPLKNRTIKIQGLGLQAISTTDSGKPSVDSEGIREISEQAFNRFGGGKAGEEAKEATVALQESKVIETLLSTFIVPLQQQLDDVGRVHCSLNLNTETGRLSCRRPNLQNQPALEKDRYKIRAAFTKEKGNKIISADYGQLELRLLAHITNCKSMLEAFRLGGDFHSRTAVGMYPKVTEAVKSGTCLLEWDYSKGKPPVPLLKDMFGTERRRAKVLNFSIAYGKTARGLASDWNVSLQEAKETLELWYRDRPEVKKWQQDTIALARKTGYTRTMMGRYRPLTLINSPSAGARNHAERAAINTPIQGGAADVVSQAMINVHNDERLKKIGWKMLLQIHDELLLEGPEENAEEALEIVKKIMENPFPRPLLVDLVVDARIGDNWYEAK